MGLSVGFPVFVPQRFPCGGVGPVGQGGKRQASGGLSSSRASGRAGRHWLLDFSTVCPLLLGSFLVLAEFSLRYESLRGGTCPTGAGLQLEILLPVLCDFRRSFWVGGIRGLQRVAASQGGACKMWTHVEEPRHGQCPAWAQSDPHNKCVLGAVCLFQALGAGGSALGVGSLRHPTECSCHELITLLAAGEKCQEGLCASDFLQDLLIHHHLPSQVPLQVSSLELGLGDSGPTCPLPSQRPILP